MKLKWDKSTMLKYVLVTECMYKFTPHFLISREETLKQAGYLCNIILLYFQIQKKFPAPFEEIFPQELNKCLLICW